METIKRKFPGWGIALITAGGVIYLALIAGLVWGALFIAGNFSASHFNIGNSSYWMDKSKEMLQNDGDLLQQAQETMEEGGITTVTRMDPDDGRPWDTVLRGKRYTYQVMYSDSTTYTGQSYTMLGIMDALNEKYGLVRIDNENGMIRYEFTRNNDLFRKTEDSLCHAVEGSEPANIQTDNASDTYAQVQDGWYLRTYREGIRIFIDTIRIEDRCVLLPFLGE